MNRKKFPKRLDTSTSTGTLVNNRSEDRMTKEEMDAYAEANRQDLARQSDWYKEHPRHDAED